MNMLLVQPLNPWDQQPDESFKAFEAFKTFRDLGLKRSYKEAHFQLTGRRTGNARWEKWSREFQWIARCSAYDRYLDSQVVQKRAKEILEMSDRHATIAVVFLNKVVARLQAIDPNTLSNDQLMKWFETAAKVERLARGESTENIKTHHTATIQNVDLSKLDDDDFDAIHSIITRATNRNASTAGVGKEKARELITVR